MQRSTSLDLGASYEVDLWRRLAHAEEAASAQARAAEADWVAVRVLVRTRVAEAWWTLAVNGAGSLLIGLLAGLFGGWETGHNARLFLVTGFLGGFTTFSAFSLDALTLWERGAMLQAALYVVGSVILSLLAAAIGLLITRLA